MGSGGIRSGEAYKLCHDRDLRNPGLIKGDTRKAGLIARDGKLGLALPFTRKFMLDSRIRVVHTVQHDTPKSDQAYPVDA